MFRYLTSNFTLLKHFHLIARTIAMYWIKDFFYWIMTDYYQISRALSPPRSLCLFLQAYSLCHFDNYRNFQWVKELFSCLSFLLYSTYICMKASNNCLLFLYVFNKLHSFVPNVRKVVNWKLGTQNMYCYPCILPLKRAFQCLGVGRIYFYLSWGWDYDFALEFIVTSGVTAAVRSLCCQSQAYVLSESSEC